jgi:hypothetical protein
LVVSVTGIHYLGCQGIMSSDTQTVKVKSKSDHREQPNRANSQMAPKVNGATG